jgi:hypothetical protein
LYNQRHTKMGDPSFDLVNLGNIEYDNMNLVLNTAVVRNVLAPYDINGQPQNLRLASTNQVILNADGRDIIGIRKDASLAVIESEPNMALAMQSGANFGAVIVGGLETRSVVDQDTNFLTSYKNNLDIEMLDPCGTLTVKGSQHLRGSLLVDDEIVAGSLNVQRAFGSADNVIGYGFTINDNGQLVLFKYDSTKGTEGVNKVINVYGDGIVNGTSTINKQFKGRTYKGRGTIGNGTDTGSGYAPISSSSAWLAYSGTNHIYYTEGNVGIGGEPSMLYPLNVTGTLKADKIIDSSGDMFGSIMSQGTLTISSIKSVKGNRGATFTNKVVFENDIYMFGNHNIETYNLTVRNDISGVRVYASDVYANMVYVNGTDLVGYITSNLSGHLTPSRLTISGANGVDLSGSSIKCSTIDASSAVFSQDVSASSLFVNNGAVVNTLTASTSIVAPTVTASTSIQAPTLAASTIVTAPTVSTTSVRTVDVSAVRVDISGITLLPMINSDTLNPQLKVNSEINAPLGVIIEGGKRVYAIPDPSGAPSSTILAVIDDTYVKVPTANTNPNLAPDILSFTSVRGGSASDDVTEYIQGTIAYGKAHDWARHGWAWKAYDTNASGIYPPNEQGTEIDMTQLSEIASGETPDDALITLIREDGTLASSDIGILSAYAIPNLQNICFLSRYIPSTFRFRNGFGEQFSIYMNDSRALPLRLYALEHAVHFPNADLHQDGTKSYVVEYIGVYNTPRYNVNYISAPVSAYTVSNDSTTRKTSYYKHNIGSAQLIRISDDYGLFPFVGLSRWENAGIATQTKILPTIYNAKIGWGSPPTAASIFQILSDRITPIGVTWLYQLYESTYLFIKYGSPMATATSQDITAINNGVLSLTSSQLVLVTSNIGGKNTLSRVMIKNSAVP